LNVPDLLGTEIAIVGMVGRFPGARNLDEFWRNLRDGVESIRFPDDQELEAMGVDAARRSDPAYVRAAADLDDIALFDAAFFGYTPRDAELMDPQQRLFLECAWEALEDAGYDPETGAGAVGVFAGTMMSTYLLHNLLPNRQLFGVVDPVQITVGNDESFLATRVSYNLNLKGPSCSVQTACSTSLVAVHLACQSLLNRECDIALAGGVCIQPRRAEGYQYTEGGMSSPDGHTRTFDTGANGTIFGNGVGIIVLKRLEDALADGDHIRAMIRGSAMNNDGAVKVGYTAPGVEGQTAVIAEALAVASVAPETIDYVEAHGTATKMGDSIEFQAMMEAFRSDTAAKNYCAVGSVKTNIGHLASASGIAGLIKTVLALDHKLIPPSLHFERPSPETNFSTSPFFVNAQLSEWPRRGGKARRAGVSSFGLGGTNAHAVLEEAPAVAAPSPSRSQHLLLLSAKTASALATATANLAGHMRHNPGLNLADVAYTLHVGRQAFSYRRMLVCRDLEEAASALETCDPRRVLDSVAEARNRPVAFMFPGMGDQYVDMGLELYQTEPAFREAVDRCAELLKPILGLDPRDALYPQGTQPRGDAPDAPSDRAPQQLDLRKLVRRGAEAPDAAAERLNQTALAHPILFMIEYATAALWMSWGITPRAMIGHSIGEYVAACLAGVFSLEDALFLVARRAQMIQALPPGAMLAVHLTEEQVQPLLSDQLSLAAVNAPGACVVSGQPDAVAAVEQQLLAKGVACLRLPTRHAFHSALMAPVVEPFRALLRQVALHPPAIPFLSNVTGDWISAAEATDPDYWAAHMRQTVRFAEGLGRLLEEPAQFLLEVGPGLTLSASAAQHPNKTDEQAALASLRHMHDPQSDVAFILTTLGRLWLGGAGVSWPGFYARERRRRLPLPTYPFERQRFWIEAPGQIAPVGAPQGKNPNIADWFFIPTWRQAPLPPPARADSARCWLVFVDDCGLGSALAARLRTLNQTVVTVAAGETFAAEDGSYILDPRDESSYIALLRDLKVRERSPDIVAHLWSVTSGDAPSAPALFDHMQERGYYSLLFLARALAQEAPERAAQIGVITSQAFEVGGNEALCPEKATLLGPCKVIPQEHEHLRCVCIDVALPGPGTRQRQQLVDCLLAELAADASEVVVAYRGGRRWLQQYAPAPLRADAAAVRPLREGGVYWLIGGLGNVGYLVGAYLARTVKARLVLSGRSGLPPRDEWAAILDANAGNSAAAQAIRHVLALEALGAEVLVASADVADEAQMRALVAQVDQRFGELHGVLHLAGATSGPSIHRPLTEIGRAESAMQFQPKIMGLYVLEKVLAGRTLDFCVLFSSSSAVLGGLGFVAYAGAHAFMDAFAIARSQSSAIPWLSANWDLWPLATSPDRGAQSSFDRYAMTPEEGQEAFRRVACLAGEGQVVVITGDLPARLDLWVRRTASRRGQPIVPHRRPALARAYVAPSNEFERMIAAIWSKVLGMEQIGVHDNFFELGGHSLLLPQILTGVRQAYQIELPVRELFEHTTIAGLAQFIADGGGQASATDEQPIAERIRVAFPTERRDLVLAYLKQKLALALGLAIDQLPADGSLSGFDPQLYAVDLLVHMKQDFGIQAFPPEIQRIRSLAAMTSFVMTEFDRVADPARLATTNPLSAYTLQPYRKRSAERSFAPSRKNKPAIFLLACPRAGSTLFRVMLAGHPGLFCPPELYLLHFETMREWEQNVGFGDALAWNRQGLEWAFGELLGVEPEASRAYIRRLVERNEPIYRVYGELQELAGERVLVDKSPTYALDLETLARAERYFESPVYIHLTRHPYTVIESFLRARLDTLLGPNLFKEPDVDPYVVAETVWAASNRTLLEFLSGVAPERQRRVRYEDLVGEPASAMTDVCSFLSLPFDKRLLHPYDNPHERMAGGIGDPNIFRHKAIEPKRGEAWKTSRLPRYLDASTQQLAVQLGYKLPGDLASSLAEVSPLAVEQAESRSSLDLDALSDEDVERMLNQLYQS
jgi:acyl transferase domain-containing protein